MAYHSILVVQETGTEGKLNEVQLREALEASRGRGSDTTRVPAAWVNISAGGLVEFQPMERSGTRRPPSPARTRLRARQLDEAGAPDEPESDLIETTETFWAERIGASRHE